MSRLAVLLLTSPFVVLGSPTAYAADLTCHGVPATIVGTPGGTVEGTGGDDVVVTDGASLTRTLAGDDLVCVTGVEQVGIVVKTGNGDDLVDTTAVAWSVHVGLGPGIDSFLGGSGEDRVDVGGGEEGPETISTGGGADFVQTGRNGQPMNEVVDTGPGADLLTLRGLPGTGSFAAGDDRKDLLQLTDRTRADWVVDDKGGALVSGAARMPATGFDWFELAGLSWSSLRFIGGPEPERVNVSKLPSPNPDGPVRVSLGGGGDQLTVGPLLTGPYNGGAARDDHLEIMGDPRTSLTRGSVSVDLDAGLSSVNGAVSSKTTSFAHVVLSDFDRSVVQGNAARNYVTIFGCRATVHGGASGDMVLFTSTRSRCGNSSESQSLTAYGDDGPDYLLGGPGDDFLMGGRGKDTVKGRGGADICSGENVSSC